MKTVLRLFVLLMGVLCLLSRLATVSHAQQAPTPTETQRLELGKPIEHELKAGEIHSYTVALDKGQLLRATAIQRKSDLRGDK